MINIDSIEQQTKRKISNEKINLPFFFFVTRVDVYFRPETNFQMFLLHQHREKLRDRIQRYVEDL